MIICALQIPNASPYVIRLLDCRHKILDPPPPNVNSWQPCLRFISARNEWNEICRSPLADSYLTHFALAALSLPHLDNLQLTIICFKAGKFISRLRLTKIVENINIYSNEHTILALRHLKTKSKILKAHIRDTIVR